MLVVRVYRGRAGGRKQKNEECGFVRLTSGPPHFWEGGSLKGEKAELLTFGKGPLGSD